MSGVQNRLALINQILKLDDNFSSSMERLSGHEWDFEGQPVMLNENVLKDVLVRFVAGDLNSATIYKWADFLELRDDVDCPENVAEIVHELPNPDTEGHLTPDRAKILLAKL